MNGNEMDLPRARQAGLCATVVLFLVTVATRAQPAPGTATAERFTFLGRSTPAAYNVALTVSPHEKSPKQAAQILLGFQDEKNHYSLTVTPVHCELRKVVAGASLVMSSAAIAPPLTVPYQLLIKRRPLLLTIAGEGRVLADTWDATYGKGRVAIENTATAPTVARPKLQKWAPVHIADDFMVEVDESIVQETVEKRTAAIAEADLSSLRQWTVVSGDWHLHSVMEDVMQADDPLLQERIAASVSKPDALRSANPFSMQATSAGPALATIGYPFWDDYHASISVNSSGSEMALVFYYQGPTNYFALRWRALSVREKAQPLELIRVTSAGTEVLAAAAALSRTNQWYRLGVETMGRHARVYLDGAVLFDVWHDAMVGGCVGLFGRGEKGTHFDDLTVDATETFPLDSGALLGEASPQSGWSVGGGKTLCSAWLEATKPAPEPRKFGPEFPVGMVLRATVQAPKAVATDATRLLAIRFGDAANGVVFELEGRIDGKGSAVQRIRLDDGKDGRVLVKAPVSLWSKTPARVEVDLSAPPLAKFYFDGRLELRCSLPAPVTGSFSVAGKALTGVRLSSIAVAAHRDEDIELPAKNVVFADDPYMLHWSSPQGAWVPAGSMTTFWHKADFLGAFSVSMPALDRAQLLFCTSRKEPASDAEAAPVPASGYALVVDRAKHTVRVDRLGKPLRDVDIGDASEFQLDRDGRYLWLSVAGKELFSFRDESPPAGTRMALVTGSVMAAEDFAGFEVTRAQVRDDYFNRAPAEWRRVGRWEVTNRFTCDPRWSHLAGMSEGGAAILWSKTEYDGDMTVEFYAGHKMRRTEEWQAEMYYPRVGDINVAICGDGEDLDSGYTVTLSGWDPTWSETWTRLRRGGKVVAESDRELVPRNREAYPRKRIIPVPWISKGRAIHGAWYYVKLRKVGNRIEYYFDNELVLSYEDPKPLSGRRIALWTHDNWVMFARAKVSYAAKETPSPLVEIPEVEPVPDPIVPEEFDSGETTVVPRVVSPSHPGLFFSFDQGLEGWRNVEGEGGAFLALSDEATSWGPRSMQLTNIETGGCFGASIPVEGMRLSGANLEFSYLVPSAAKVNIYLKLEDPTDRWYFIQFTGEKASTPAVTRIGAISGVKPGKRWRTASFALGHALAALRPDDPDLRVLEMRIGNFHEGYAGSGISGNPKGCSYRIDNFRIATAGIAPLRVGLVPSDGAGQDCVFSADRQPVLRKAPPADALSATGVFETLRPGRSYVHAWPKEIGAKTGPLAIYPVDVIGAAFDVHSVYPKETAAWKTGPVSVSFTPATGPGLDFGSVRVLINGYDLARDAGAVTYSHAKRRLTIDPRWAAISFADGETVAFELSARSTDGKPISHRWSYTMKRSLDRYGPVRFQLLNYPLNNAFTRNLAPCESNWGRGGVQLALDRKTGVGGKGCLRGTNIALSGPSGVALYQRPFSAGRYPLLSFDYRLPKTYHLDLVIDSEAGWQSIRLTDTDSGIKPIAEIAAVVSDDTWQHAEVNLATILGGLSGGAGRLDVNSLLLIDRGYKGVGPNETFYLDNLNLVPAVSGLHGITLRWDAQDLSGISEFRYRWHARPSLSPNLKLPGDLREHTFYLETEGEQYFHFQAYDGNRRPSSALHYRFLVDNTPPQWGTPYPAPGTRSAPGMIAVPLVETGAGLDTAELSLQVNGAAIAATDPRLTFDPKEGKLMWDWAAGSAALGIADGETVACSAGPVRDFAGNVSPRIEWEWLMDYSRDTVPPPPPVISASSHRVLSLDTFEEDNGDWLPRTFDFYTTTVARLARTKTPPDHCVRIYDYRRYETLAIVRTESYDLSAFPIVSFDYRVRTGADVDWVFQVNGKRHRVRMTSSKGGPETIGRVPNVLADNAWHSTSFDLGAFIRRVLPDVAKPTVESIALGTFNLEENTKRYYFFLDNVMISGPGSRDASFQFASGDVTGITGFSHVVDRVPDTVPGTESPSTTEDAIEVGPLEAGAWYIHCRARDGAGLWGGVSHYTYVVGGK